MDARQLLRMLSEHGPEARAEVVARMAALDTERAGLVDLLAALDESMTPADRMIRDVGKMEREVVT